MIKVWVYPANSVIGGPIEERVIVKANDKKVWYDKRDQYGYLGAKRSGVFMTEEQALDEREMHWLVQAMEDKERNHQGSANASGLG